ncbi:hypothetical protein EDB85DRAFT_1895210 [Lactarius pseudohatsudake]|nr:hypothetical protein EDB85DRAFT_1895210 [Lactarius pseudohatsudake]
MMMGWDGTEDDDRMDDSDGTIIVGTVQQQQRRAGKAVTVSGWEPVISDITQHGSRMGLPQLLTQPPRGTAGTQLHPDICLVFKDTYIFNHQGCAQVWYIRECER